MAAPIEAGWNPLTWTRDAIRATTVWLMKDRSGRVGARGVADLVRMLAEASTDSRLALAGHSYGSKVMLSALCSGPAPSRNVDSLLLLEPALSCYAFTDSLDGHSGGYRKAFDRVRLPIIATYSSHDVPLRKFFHLAVRRKSDLAEAVIAGQPPSKFAALGGYGPQGVEAEWINMPAVGDPYPLTTPCRIIGVNGSKFIASHGGVETPETAWALLSQVEA
jgi:pimeloyl-ACP methyl ester carboxylesterase